MDLLVIGLFFAIPIGVIIWFIVNTIQFIKCPKEQVEKRKERKTLMIASGVLSGLFILAYATLIICFAISLSHM